MTSILVQGWRGISHSYAMVNQYQLLELMRRPDLTLYHEDLPFYRNDWSAKTSFSGFAAQDAAKLAALAPPTGQVPDIVYRIAFPLRFYGAAAGRIFCFGTSENQHVPPDMLYQGVEAWQRYPVETIDIVTPSQWSKEGFLRYGFADARVHVVPHGVDPAIFRPMPRHERQDRRRAIGLPQDKFIFLNLGATTANKGINTLIRAFAEVHRRRPDTLLLLKDSRSLYGFDVEEDIADAMKKYGYDPSLLGAIAVIPDNLDLERMRELYCLADAYVSPYRAEGFNLPPLEAAACGLPVLITEGGSTDDYAHPSFARPITARKRSRGAENWLEVDLDSLIAGMEELADGRSGCNAEIALPWIAENFSWAAATEKLVRALVG
jgi:glycosyltransferase involved in cell wall biosynthesis